MPNNCRTLLANPLQWLLVLLDRKTTLPFGQPVIVHVSQTKPKLHFRGVPADQSSGYLIYIPIRGGKNIVDTTNYAIIRDVITISKNETYSDSIFDHIL